MRRLVASYDEQPGGIAVQSVDDSGPLGIVSPSCPPGQSLDERACRMPSRWMNNHPSGLVDYQQRLVLVGDPEVGRCTRVDSTLAKIALVDFNHREGGGLR